MARKEEIVQKSMEFSPTFVERRVDFVQGAEWADKTMIEKAAEWLSIMLDNQVVINNMDLFLTKFRKAMMEG